MKCIKKLNEEQEELEKLERDLLKKEKLKEIRRYKHASEWRK